MVVRKQRLGVQYWSLAVNATFNGGFAQEDGGSMKLDFPRAIATFVISPFGLFDPRARDPSRSHGIQFPGYGRGGAPVGPSADRLWRAFLQPDRAARCH